MKITTTNSLLACTSLLITAYAAPVFTFSVECNGNLDNLVSSSATSLLNSASYPKARKSLLNLMVKEPDQLLKDLNRLTEIKIGSSSIKKALEAINQSDVNVKACARYKKVAEDLKKYIKSSDSSLPNLELEGFLGNFLTIEVVYVLVQTLLAEPVLKTIETLGEEFITKFPSIEDNTLSTSFVYSKSTKTLTVTNTSSKKMWDEEMFAAQNSGTLPLKCTFFKCYTPYQTKSLVRFNLATGSVIFDYEYSFGSKSGKWSTEVI